MTSDRILYTELPAINVRVGDLVNGRDVHAIRKFPDHGLVRFIYLTGFEDYAEKWPIARVERRR